MLIQKCLGSTGIGRPARLCVRVWVDWEPYAEVVVTLGALGVYDLKDGAGSIVWWGWLYVPDLAGLEGAWWCWVGVAG